MLERLGRRDSGALEVFLQRRRRGATLALLSHATATAALGLAWGAIAPLAASRRPQALDPSSTGQHLTRRVSTLRQPYRHWPAPLPATRPRSGRRVGGQTRPRHPALDCALQTPLHHRAVLSLYLRQRSAGPPPAPILLPSRRRPANGQLPMTARSSGGPGWPSNPHVSRPSCPPPPQLRRHGETRYGDAGDFDKHPAQCQRPAIGRAASQAGRAPPAVPFLSVRPWPPFRLLGPPQFCAPRAGCHRHMQGDVAVGSDLRWPACVVQSGQACYSWPAQQPQPTSAALHAVAVAVRLMNGTAGTVR